MTHPDANLDVTLDQLVRMHRAIAGLNAERARYGDAWFAVMAEGPIEELRRLEAEVGRLTDRPAAEATAVELWLAVSGDGIRWPEAPASVLTSFVDTLRKGIQAVAEWVASGSLSARPTKDMNEACDLRVVAMEMGSLRVGLRLPDAPTQEPAASVDEARPARVALGHYLSAVTWAGGTHGLDTLEAQFPAVELRQLLLTQVKRLLPRLRGRVDSVSLSGRAFGTANIVHLTRTAHVRVNTAIDSTTSVTSENYEGDVREIDLDNRSLILRNIDGQNDVFEVECAFGPEMARTAQDAVDRRVAVTGVREAGATRRARKLRLLRLDVIDPESADPK